MVDLTDEAILTKCQKCGHQISTHARRCPGCKVSAEEALGTLLNPKPEARESDVEEPEVVKPEVVEQRELPFEPTVQEPRTVVFEKSSSTTNGSPKGTPYGLLFRAFGFLGLVIALGVAFTNLSAPKTPSEAIENEYEYEGEESDYYADDHEVLEDETTRGAEKVSAPTSPPPTEVPPPEPPPPPPEEPKKVNPFPDGNPNVQGSVTKSEIRETVKKHRRELWECYASEFQKDSSLKGRIVVRLTIGPTGKVASAVVADADLDSIPIEDCLIRRLKKIPFPETKGGGIAIVVYPFKFDGDAGPIDE